MQGIDMSQAVLHFRGNNVAFFETEDAILHILKEHVALLEVKRGRALDVNHSRHCLDLLERLVSSNYSIVINRCINERLQYESIYEAIEDRKRLSKIAVTWNGLGIDWEECAPVCQKKLSLFQNIDDAISWANSVN